MGSKFYPYIGRGNQRNVCLKSITMNIDNGAGATTDDQICNLPYDAQILDVRAIYTEATDTTGAASANFKLGIAAGGATIVAATPLTAATAIGGTTAGVVVAPFLPANTTLWVRHTGVATTEVGQYFIQVTLIAKP